MAETSTCEGCSELLSEALDLCARSRKLDEGWGTVRSGTIPLWVGDQYERDLLDWERRARTHLQEARND